MSEVSLVFYNSELSEEAAKTNSMMEDVIRRVQAVIINQTEDWIAMGYKPYELTAMSWFEGLTYHICVLPSNQLPANIGAVLGLTFPINSSL